MTKKKPNKRKRLVFEFALISPDKEIRRVVKALEDAGFLVTKNTNKHIKIVNPKTGKQASIPSTPAGNGRQRQNMYMTLRQIGFDVSEFKGTPKKKKVTNE
jgi:predicted RNA binding protein YcfA (HicA-like mRNA interferase family)